ncbi:MAG: 2-oxoacid:ferredoxin oxidoreductase subunit beta [Verrucomicrobiota bacterium]|nr:2-oxoacid:ferredoxin oxidoreductase subunit beta [Verrucomicrobiota bacterium]
MNTTLEPPVAAPLSRKDFVPPNDVRWCPGCGDYAILNAIQRTFPELGVPKEKFVIVSGIGCSSRFPYYMETYGFHSIHGRAPTVATGVKVANPDLSVWVVTGDGDGLSIGGNHLLHALRRNVNIKVLLFNNRIYGLTKGQYSPTSPVGIKTKTTPLGAIDYPVNPLLFAIASEATFVARTVDSNVKHMTEIFKAAHEHEGVAFVEIMQNCVIFNDGTWDSVAARENRDSQLIYLEAGQPLRFGAKKEKGIRIKGFQPEVVALDEQPDAVKELLVHDPVNNGALYAEMLARMVWPELPTPVGILRNVLLPTYDTLVTEQMNQAIKRSGVPTLEQILNGGDTWKVE